MTGVAKPEAEDAELKKAVFEALDHAVENGYRDLIYEGAIELVANDILDCDTDVWSEVVLLGLEESAATSIRPFIEAWRAARAS